MMTKISLRGTVTLVCECLHTH
uniref:Uncharacterized protein n=1 Tax=Anguilla anguilla TaxID=7936 RepID=A0A0E9RB16_ANGAN